MITVSAFKWVPAFAQGYVRDLRVRWALEEAGLPYEAILIDREIQDSESYRSWQPFGQVPALRDGDVEMFESGAIVLYLADRSDVLAPRGALARARVTSWVLSALNSVEPCVRDLVHLDVFHAGEAWTAERRPHLRNALERRLGALATWLGDKPYLEERFTAGDLVMSTVLRELGEAGVLDQFTTLQTYLRRCLARPAFSKALADQIETFAANSPAKSGPE